MTELTIRPVHGIGEVSPGDNLAAMIADAAPWLADGDILVVTSKIISKAEGNLVSLPPNDGPERDRAREAALDAQTARVVARRGQTRIVQTRQGFVLAAGGIDASNVDRGHLVLLPDDPDASAHRLRDALQKATHKDVAVIVSDTMGRPWRLGLTDVAIGAAGIGALRDHRGEADAYGNLLQLTQVAVIDELAAAAELVKGKADQVPVAVIRGYAAKTVGEGARALLRAASEDLFSLGTAEARAEGLRAAARMPEDVEFADAPLPAGAVDRALSIVDAPVRRLDPSHSGAGPVVPSYCQMILEVRAVTARDGAAVQRLQAALAAEGLASVWLDGVIAVGVPATGSR
jgi:coenzyme F420-0:L-glutamate ligase / coenzyme F420-1:gamma-L-glutamate ligase